MPENDQAHLMQEPTKNELLSGTKKKAKIQQKDGFPEKYKWQKTFTAGRI
jgi:hypothetical protein